KLLPGPAWPVRENSAWGDEDWTPLTVPRLSLGKVACVVLAFSAHGPFHPAPPVLPVRPVREPAYPVKSSRAIAGASRSSSRSRYKRVRRGCLREAEACLRVERAPWCFPELAFFIVRLPSRGSFALGSSARRRPRGVTTPVRSRGLLLARALAVRPGSLFTTVGRRRAPPAGSPLRTRRGDGPPAGRTRSPLPFPRLAG